MKLSHLFILSVISCSVSAFSQPTKQSAKTSGNPVFPGWYADPEGAVFGDEYWIYPTYSAPYDDQIFMDAYSSKDLVNWTKHPRVLAKENISWLRRALWAPAVIQANGKYYFFFGANDIKNNEEVGGIGVAVADNPAGPFKDAIGKPLIDKIVNGAQPIDQFVFKDDDGQHYMYYGGWGHCNIVKMAPDLLSIVPFDDGTIYKEVTPENYTEGPFMLKRGGKYYFMWSEGGWGNSDYSVAYAIADSPFGPFERVGKILQQDANIAVGAGHHSIVKGAGAEEWYIIYHRRPLGETAANSRETCIDRMYFNGDGTIRPVKMTFEGVKVSPLKSDGSYTNPVIDYSLPDPTIIKGDDGYFYLYATEDIKNLPIHRSKNLVDWEYVGTAFTKATRPTFEPKGGIWAPDIEKIGNQYVLYYSMSTWGGEWTCGVGIATADKPEGPFTDRGKLFRSNEIDIQNCIDPFYIEDKGKKYLFWGSFHGLYGTELSANGFSLKKDAPMVQIAGTAYEGIYIHKRDGYYYLFASIGRCCEGLNSTYTTVVGRSKSLFGPYVDKSGKRMLKNNHEVLIQKNEAFVGPGHNSELITDKNGEDWLFYHAINVAKPEGRALMLDKVQWKEGWPSVGDSTPSLIASTPKF